MHAGADARGRGEPKRQRVMVIAGIAEPDPRFLAARDNRDYGLLLLGNPVEEAHHHDLLVLAGRRGKLESRLPGFPWHQRPARHLQKHRPTRTKT